MTVPLLNLFPCTATVGIESSTPSGSTHFITTVNSSLFVNWGLFRVNNLF